MGRAPRLDSHNNHPPSPPLSPPRRSGALGSVASQCADVHTDCTNNSRASLRLRQVWMLPRKSTPKISYLHLWYCTFAPKHGVA
jgi:hypothetical protein